YPYTAKTDYHPEQLLDSAHIADVVLDTEFTPSLYGDANLHFKHTAFDEDIKGRPDWEQIVRYVRK
ncbi:hypothetical protein HK104_002185, partial [Borealophlyctis nickersoniae]